MTDTPETDVSEEIAAGNLHASEQQQNSLNSIEDILRMFAKLDKPKQAEARQIIRTLKDSQQVKSD